MKYMLSTRRRQGARWGCRHQGEFRALDSSEPAKCRSTERRNYANHAEATRDITDYIVGFYNSVRLYSKLGYLAATAYEREMADKQPIGVSETT